MLRQSACPSVRPSVCVCVRGGAGGRAASPAVRDALLAYRQRLALMRRKLPADHYLRYGRAGQEGRVAGQGGVPYSLYLYCTWECSIYVCMYMYMYIGW